MTFQSWNDFNDGFAKLFHANEARKKRAAEMAYYRDIHAEILAILHEEMPKPDDMLQFMNSAQDAADEIIKLFRSHKHE